MKRQQPRSVVAWQQPMHQQRRAGGRQRRPAGRSATTAGRTVGKAHRSERPCDCTEVLLSWRSLLVLAGNARDERDERATGSEGRHIGQTRAVPIVRGGIFLGRDSNAGTSAAAKQTGVRALTAVQGICSTCIAWPAGGVRCKCTVASAAVPVQPGHAAGASVLRMAHGKASAGTPASRPPHRRLRSRSSMPSCSVHAVARMVKRPIRGRPASPFGAKLSMPLLRPKHTSGTYSRSTRCGAEAPPCRSRSARPTRASVVT
jgi:hypothetical protein